MADCSETKRSQTYVYINFVHEYICVYECRSIEYRCDVSYVGSFQGQLVYIYTGCPKHFCQTSGRDRGQ